MTAAIHPNNPIAHLDDAAFIPDDVIPYDYVGGYDDMLKMTTSPSGTPVPGQEMMDPPYRCPVSTPANFVHPSPRVRRTKPMPVSLEITLTPCSPSKRSAGGKPPRPGGPATHRTLSHHTNNTTSGSKILTNEGGGGRGARTLPLSPGMGKRKGGSGLGGAGVGVGVGAGALNSRSLQYYYVDKAEEQREAAETNTFWLKALCSQPVTEILDKYKRRSDLRRTRLLWSRTYTTPGERSLLRAWERNGPRPSALPLPAFCGLRAPTHPHPHPAPGPLPHHPHAQSAAGARTKTASSASGTRSGLPRHQSEPFDRSRGYPSDDGEDDTEDEEEARAGSSTVSADVTFSSPRSSDRLQSPRQRSPASSEFRKRRSRKSASETERVSGGLVHPRMVNGHSAHSAERAYDLSEHFQVSLPSVSGRQRGRWERLGTPTTTTRPSFSRDRRPRPLGDLSGDVTSQVSEPSPRESTVSRGVASTSGSTLPTDTPRSDNFYTTLPAITRA